MIRKAFAVVMLSAVTQLPTKSQENGFMLARLTAGPKTAGLELPADFTVAQHKLVIVTAQSTGEVKFLVTGTVPIEHAVNGKSIVFAAPSAGEKVQVYAVACVENKLTEFVRCEITVAQSDGPKPPPPPPPTPEPKPEPPKPEPVEGKLHITLVEDVNARTPAIARILVSKTLRDALESKNAIVRLFDIRDPVLKQRQLDTKVTDAKVRLPAVIIQTDTGRFLARPTAPESQVMSLPATEAEILQLVREITGR